MRADVVVIGAGLAGMTAALAAERAGAAVVLIDRGPVGTGTNTALSNAAFSGPVSAECAEEYVDLVCRIGKGLNCLASVRRIARGAPAAVAALQGFGLDLEQERTPGHWIVQPEHPGQIPGVALVRAVAAQVARRHRITARTGVFVQSLLKDDDGIAGVRGIDLEGHVVDVRASAVVLACGGSGAIYARHDNQATTMGQGYRLAAGAGLDLFDMEFVQFYPVVLDEPDMPRLIVYPPYPPAMRFIGPAGEDLLEKHGWGKVREVVRRRRDDFSMMLAKEREAGPVCIDFRDVPDETWEVHPLAILKRFRETCRRRPIRIAPAVHFFMGGVRTDDDGRTAVRGLYATGEIVWGLHGANRMGGNALMECLVSGPLAGCGAAGWASEHPAGAGAPVFQTTLSGPGTTRVDLRQARQRLREVAWSRAGIVRSAEGMAAGLGEASAAWQALRAAHVSTIKEQVLREDLLCGAFTLRAVLSAGLGRLESRGSFQREDHPAQDDGAWLRNSRLRWDHAGDRFEVAYVPVDTDAR